MALFLLVPALLSDLPLFSRTAHSGSGHPGSGHAAQNGAAAQPGAGGGGIALLPLERGAWHPEHDGGNAAAATGDGFGLHGGTLQNLVYRMPGDDTGAAPRDDGGWRFGGDDPGGGEHGSGHGGAPSGFGPSGFGGINPGTDDPPFPFAPDPGPHQDTGPGGGNPPFFSPPGPSTLAAVPEPATWALFILGFGLIGAQLRRARAVQPALTKARVRRLG